MLLQRPLLVASVTFQSSPALSPSPPHRASVSNKNRAPSIYTQEAHEDGLLSPFLTTQSRGASWSQVSLPQGVVTAPMTLRCAARAVAVDRRASPQGGLFPQSIRSLPADERHWIACRRCCWVLRHCAVCSVVVRLRLFSPRSVGPLPTIELLCDDVSAFHREPVAKGSEEWRTDVAAPARISPVALPAPTLSPR